MSARNDIAPLVSRPEAIPLGMPGSSSGNIAVKSWRRSPKAGGGGRRESLYGGCKP